MKRRIAFGLACAMALCLLHQNALAQAEADGVIDSLEFTFRLAPNTSVTPGDFKETTVQIGTGGVGAGYVMTSLASGENRDASQTNTIDMSVGTVSAFAPSPDFSHYVHEVAEAFTFANYSDSPVNIQISWSATCWLLANGDTSVSQVDVTETQASLLSGEISDSQHLFFATQRNDGTAMPSPVGAFSVLLGPALSDGTPSRTILTLGATVASLAAVPEPSIVAFGGIGALVCAYTLRRARRPISRP